MTSNIRNLESSNCKSCEFQFESVLPFCPNCGGRVIQKRLTIKSVFQEFYQNIFNIDNKFIGTIRDLTICPDKVFKAYISGARRKYYNPVSFIAIAIVLSTLTSSFLLEKFEKSDNSELQENLFELGLKGAGGSEEELQKKMEDPEFQKKIEKSKQESLEFNKKYNDFLKNNLGFIAYLNIPIYALIAFLVFMNKKLYNFAEMVSIILYQNAYTTLIGFLLSLLFFSLDLNGFILAALSFLIIFIYSNYSFQRLFKLNAKQLIIANLKFFLVSFVLFLLLIILGIALVVFVQFVF
jgi:hypothetical protein